jgi:hypothetical protein
MEAIHEAIAERNCFASRKWIARAGGQTWRYLQSIDGIVNQMNKFNCNKGVIVAELSKLAWLSRC